MRRGARKLAARKASRPSAAGSAAAAEAVGPGGSFAEQVIADQLVLPAGQLGQRAEGFAGEGAEPVRRAELRKVEADAH